MRGVAATGEKDSAIRVSFKAKKTGKTSKFTFAAKVKVVAKEEEKPAEVLGLDGVTQKKSSEFTVSFKKELDKVAVSNFVLTRDDDAKDMQIKTADLNATDKTKVTMTTYLSLTDGKSYTLSYTDADKNTTKATFIASDGKLAAFGLTPLKVTAGTATELKYQSLDANGVVLGETKVGEAAAGITVSYTFTNTTGSYPDGSKIYMPTIGDKATVTVEKHTYVYNADGTEKDTIKGVFEVEAVSAATTVESYDYTVATKEPAWEKLTSANTKIALNDSGYNAYFRIKDSNGAYVTGNGYTVESADTSIVIANGSASEASLTPVKEGSTVLIVKDANGNSIKTVNIQVVAKRVLSSIAVDRGSVSFAKQCTNGAIIYVTGKDQYGVACGIDSLEVTRNFVTDNKIDFTTSTTGSTPYVMFDSEFGATAGTFSYQVKANDKIPTTLTVSVSDTSSVTKPSYGFDFALVADDGTNANVSVTAAPGTVAKSAKFNLTTSSSSKTANGTTIRAYAVQRKNGVTVGTAGAVSLSAIKVYKVGGSTYVQSGAGVSKPTTTAAIDDATNEINSMFANTGITGSFDIVGTTVATTDGVTKFKKHLAPGTYKVVATFKDANGTHNTEDTFTVVDDQSAITATVFNEVIDSNDIVAALSNTDNAKFYDAAGKVTATVVKATGKANGKSAYIKSVDVVVTIDSTRTVLVEGVAINKTFTTKNAGNWVNVSE